MLVCLAGAWSATIARGAAATFDTEARTEMTIERPTGSPYVGEMILLRMRSAIRANIALYEMRQPDMEDFDWQQFGRDTPYETVVDGFAVPGVERVLAIFARRPGHFRIPPFTRHVTIVTRDNRRVEADFSSAALDLDILPNDTLGHPGDLWLPAEDVRLTEAWDPAPDTATRMTALRRTVTLEARGITPDRLPPIPRIETPGTSVFAGPAERSGEVTEDGPVARVTYRWTIRLTSEAGTMLPALRLPWFDTGLRTMQEATLPARTIGPVAASQPGAESGPLWRWQSLFAPVSLLAAFLGMVWMLGAAFLLASSRAPQMNAIHPLDAAVPLEALRGTRKFLKPGKVQIMAGTALAALNAVNRREG